ncbi:hypothetical protein DXX93_12680 [Thalassotalea euphylliae]|uniref:Uncharacterized protein n=1 Tax=Thalassotalea euphylliae TaxID=1655234 RepID=A0A3E0TYG8_9GAMM|nr:hypothetical protein DXX93_12680 [Thalassotalea euphylliae]
MLSLFQSKPLLDESTTHWIIDSYQWALTHFDAQEFKTNSQLVLPTSEFYPGRVSSVEEMAASVFEKTLAYAGMKNWPIKLISPAAYHQNPQYQQMPKLQFGEAIRGDTVQVFTQDFSQTANANVHNHIYVSYNPNQINQPQDLVASYAQAFAAILIAQKGIEPPGGEKFLPQAIDLMASFLGFGVMFANTAYQFKGGCGSCYNKYANREVALPENEMVYCLALFTVLKNIEVKQVTQHLKSHLRGEFKKAVKELSNKRNTPAFKRLASA